jgi:hypothetical protein
MWSECGFATSLLAKLREQAAIAWFGQSVWNIAGAKSEL